MPSLLPSDRPTLRRRLRGWVEPAVLYAALEREGESRFWLDSGPHAASGMSFLGSAEVSMTATAGGVVTWHPSGESERMPVLAALRRGLVAADAALLGWVGWLGYGMAAQTEGLAVSTGSRYPDAAFLRVERMIAVDHDARTVDLVDAGHDEAAAATWFDTVESALSDSGASPRSSTLQRGHERVARWRDDDERYLAAIAECQRAIVEGEAYQLCLTTEVTVDGVIDPVSVWSALRRASPSHHGGIIQLAAAEGRSGLSVVSSSPESFLEVESDGMVRSSPIKGTRPRSQDPSLDRELAEELRASVKEQAENLMIVDLMRNDLGRVCEVGSVAVTSLFVVQSYAQVHQLVSVVEGRLTAGRHPVDAVSACFPAGSMTGAPKRRAMDLLEGIERRPRGPYSGSFGYLGVDGSVDLAMTIRSLVIDDEGATIGTGGGITALSEPAEELAEVKLKASALLTALGVA